MPSRPSGGATGEVLYDRMKTAVTGTGPDGGPLFNPALVDLLRHHCHIVNIRGNSCRMREHQALLRPESEESREGDRS